MVPSASLGKSGHSTVVTSSQGSGKSNSMKSITTTVFVALFAIMNDPYWMFTVHVEGRKTATEQRKQSRQAKRQFNTTGAARRADNKKGKLITVSLNALLLFVLAVFATH